MGAVEDGDHLRIELTFSEPMAAYVGSGRARVDPSVFDLSNYSFMVGQNSVDLTNEDMEGASVLVPAGPPPTMNASLRAKQEFRFDGQTSGAYVVAKGGDLTAYPNAAVAIEVEPDAPSQVNIWFRDGARADQELFKGYRSLKARVSGLKDPAGKNITDTEADKNLVTATI